MRIPKRVLLPAVLIIAISLIAIHINATIERITLLSGKIGQFESRIEVLEGKVRILEDPLIPAIGFTFLSRLYDMDALQGVASDGTYLYNTGSTDTHDDYHLYKRQKNGTLVTSNDHPETDGTDCAQVNGIFIKDSKLYVGAFTTEVHSYVKVFDTSDLSYIEEHEVAGDGCEGGFYHDGYWWIIYTYEKYVSKYNDSWEWVADYNLAFEVEATYPNGIYWDGNYMYINNHENASRDTMDCYLWNGSSFDFVAGLDRPTSECTQGFYKELGEDYLWWAERNGSGQGIHNIVKSTIEHS